MSGVSAIIVTRGDVDLVPIVASLPEEWELLVWDNGCATLRIDKPGTSGDHFALVPVGDVSVYGRYAAIEHAAGDVIYVQDDDVIVSDPRAIVAPLIDVMYRGYGPGNGVAPFLVGLPVVCNMPPEFRHDFYADNALVGFGAAFHRAAPDRAFSRFMLSSHANGVLSTEGGFFDRTCDIAFTGLCDDVTGGYRLLVDVPIEHLPYATGSDRMYRQPQHVGERTRMRELVREIASKR